MAGKIIYRIWVCAAVLASGVVSAALRVASRVQPSQMVPDPPSTLLPPGVTSLPLPKAASMLHEKGTQRLIVVDEKRCPVGVLTRGDVVRALASAQA